MQASERRRLRERGILLATLGLMLAMGVGLALKLLGVVEVELGHWYVAVGVTLLVQALLWLIPHLGWDARLAWDPHYLFVPTLGAALLLDTYVYLIPDSRVRILMVWFVALLFMAGRAGFAAVVALSAAMTAGWLLAIWPHALRSGVISMAYEASIAVTFWIITVAAGVVFERLKRERLETSALRRRLAELALTDALTGLPNRRQFEDALRAELARIARSGGRCSVVMVDVDYFKVYNDQNGHVAGDEVLKELAVLLRGHLRAGDLAARYGGEEFALLMPSTGKEEGLRVIERLRGIVEDHPFAGCETQPSGRLTFSAGIASCGEDGSDYETLLRRADTALYAAKKAGRNRVFAEV